MNKLKSEKSFDHQLRDRWAGMKRRCLCPTAEGYHNYGGRGIGICEEWKNSFNIFKEWAVANGYDRKLEIDRKDNDKGYCPENCHWVTHKQNSKNKRTVRLYDGKTIGEIAQENGIKRLTVVNRMRKHGMTPQQAASYSVWPYRDLSVKFKPFT